MNIEQVFTNYDWDRISTSGFLLPSSFFAIEHGVIISWQFDNGAKSSISIHQSAINNSSRIDL